MNVLLTHERFPPDFGGGGEHIVLETARHLLRRGLEVRVLTTGDPNLTNYEGVPTVRLPMHRYRMNLAVGAVVEMTHRADLIHTFNYHACVPSLLAARRTRKPVVCSVLGLYQEAWKQMKGPLVGWFSMAWERFLLTRRFSRVLFLSEYSRQQGIALGVPKDRALVSTPGIDLQAYTPAPQKENVVLFVGKLDARKGIADILAAARALPHVRFQVAGWGPEQCLVRRTAPSNMEFLGFLKGASLRRAFAQANIFIFPSRAETFGMAIGEAMASGCAVISSVPLEFEGIWIPANCCALLIEAIQKLWSNPEEAQRMGRRNVELARTFTWERYVATLLGAYEEALQESKETDAR